MVHESSMKVGGAYTRWPLSEWSLRHVLVDGLGRLGYKDFVPEARSATACLKDALSEIFTEKQVEIKPLAGTGSYEIIRVNKGEHKNSYDHLYCVSVDDERRVSLRPLVPDLAQRILAGFNEQLGLLRSGQVTTCLVKILLRRLDGTTIGPRGGLYWLPPHHIDAWTQVAQVVEASGYRTESKVYLLRHLMDADAVRAIRDSIIHEIQTRSGEIRQEVLDQDNPLKSLALQHRHEELLALRDKARLYESLLGVGLEQSVQTLDEVETTIGQAALLVAAVPA